MSSDDDLNISKSAVSIINVLKENGNNLKTPAKLNEIDVLTLTGNIPTFISCKSGRMDGYQALHVLYELETVTRKFGGRYARKVLVLCSSLNEVYHSRADEMGIEVWEMAK